MAYTTIDAPTNFFDTLTYTGDSSTNQKISGLDFQPDYVWVKIRSTAHPHTNIDSVRGANKYLKANETAAEQTDPQYGYLSTFDNDGFTTQKGSHANPYNINQTGQTYVGWCWKAGTSFTNDASSTGIGDIDSAGSVSTDAGISICSFTGNGSNSQTVKHGLSQAPEFIILKARGQGTYGWITYDAINGAGKYMNLAATHAAVSDTGMWSNTAPTSSVFSLSNGGNTAITNPNTVTMISYCFHSVKGYSKIGSFIGNGSTNGPFLHCGFSPAWFLVKRTNGANSWYLYDNKRPGYNLIGSTLSPNTNGTEIISSSYNSVDFVSNGVKIRQSNADLNTNGSTYIFMAFAESPFVNSNGVPTNAR